ncbi:hypothetical protein N431DRAFT_485643 [Stipitochalara longipes BDJ]|nr:hypothetical protein N431DRAFT_485643 [Stipitochalara longipes BDJ]
MSSTSSPSSRSSSTAGALDVAARGIDLTTALIEASSSPNKIIHLAIELGQWLGRERLNRFQLEDFMQKGRGLVQPNEKAESFYNEVLEGEKAHPIANLSLKQSGSLGRLMVRDPWLSWIVSTTACLFECHRENYVPDTLCMILLQGSMPSGANISRHELQRHLSRIQLKSVADKLVLSVWFNVVNSGNSTIPLPDVLGKICPRGHNLESEDLAAIINALRIFRQRVIIRSTHLLLDLTRWLLLHLTASYRSLSAARLFTKNVSELLVAIWKFGLRTSAR